MAYVPPVLIDTRTGKPFDMRPQQPHESRMDYLVRCFRNGYYTPNLMTSAELDAVVMRIHRESIDNP